MHTLDSNPNTGTSWVDLPNHLTSLNFIPPICKKPHRPSRFFLGIQFIMVTQKTKSFQIMRDIIMTVN